jgi:hypothetical protein
MVAVGSSETLLSLRFYQTTRRHTPEYNTIQDSVITFMGIDWCTLLLRTLCFLQCPLDNHVLDCVTYVIASREGSWLCTTHALFSYATRIQTRVLFIITLYNRKRIATYYCFPVT